MDVHPLIFAMQLEPYESGLLERFLEIGSGLFTLVLFFLTLYSWTRRGRQPTLLIVSFAFLAFFVKQILELAPLTPGGVELISSILDFVTLALFFVALVLRPRRKNASTEAQDWRREDDGELR
ncbi:MAG: hypothetical protein JRN20_20595 [Nitrososphaerota archaeon]|nr:hypothetical protein [Nitrososphaerota archaeon]